MLVIDPSPRRPVPAESWMSRHALWLMIGVGTLISGGSYWALRGAAPPLALRAVANQSVLEGQSLVIQLVPEWHSQSRVPLECGMYSGPPTASMDSQTGRWLWTPDADSGGRTYRVRLGARGVRTRTPRAACEFSVTVIDVARPPVIEPVEEQFVELGESVRVAIRARDPDGASSGMTYRLGERSPAGAVIDATSGQFRWTPTAEDVGRSVAVRIVVTKPGKPSAVSAQREFVVAVSAATDGGLSEQAVAGEPATLAPVVKAAGVTSTEAKPPVQLPVVEVDAQLLGALEKLYREGVLFDPAQYPTLRGLFAEHFAREHAAQLKSAFQGTGAQLERWLGQHPELRDELYVACEPTDDVVAALKILERLHGRSFQRLTAFPELAIAIAVTWDREADLYDYTVQQRRSHATVSREKTCDAVDNFDYYSSAEFMGQRRVSKLPWEFLKHVVDHRTPLDERQWVQRTYHDSRRPIGQCYEDVPYDHGMIKSGEKTSNLASNAYTLANLKDRGGICVMQADYATRVAKSLGIPAAYVEGSARNNARHAWVMWTELQTSGAAGVTFTLQSHGRFFLDRYYVGSLRDPQSGRWTTDRDLEARLQGVGMNPFAYRQANLIMRLWPQLTSRLGLTFEQELDLFDAVMELSPGNQAVWDTVALRVNLGRSNAELRPRLDKLRDRCIKTFTNCPDVACRIIDNLLSYDPDLERRLLTYDRLLQQWTSTGRPDLACELRLKMTRQLVSDKQYQVALGGLAQTIKRFPDEGRHIPQLLDEYERVAKNVEEGQAKVVKLYRELMPLVPRQRQGQPSPFYKEMQQRSTQRYAQAAKSG